MGNAISSFLSGFGNVVNKLFGSPLDFLAGKSCSSVCGSTWDFICYIENFCVAHLLKLAMVSALFYLVLMFFYSLYKLGICQCVSRTLCKMVWACFATCFYVAEYSCSFICYKLPKLKRRIHRKRDIEEFIVSSSGSSTDNEDGKFSHNVVPRQMEEYRRRSVLSHRCSSRDYKGDHLRRSLKARNHQVQVGIRGGGGGGGGGQQGSSSVHDLIKVTRTSKFAQKGPNYKGSTPRTRRR